MERARRQNELARQLMRQAERSSRTPEEALEAVDALALLHVDLEDDKALEAALERAEGLVPRVRDRYILARHLETVGRVQQEHGRRSEAAISFAACKSLYEAMDMPARAANAQLLSGLRSRSGDLEQAWNLATTALEAYSQMGEREGEMRALRAVREVGARLPARKQALRKLLSQTAETMPEGAWQARARQEWARHLINADADYDAAEKLLRQNLARPDLDWLNKVESLHLLGNLLGHKGQYEAAADVLREALDVAQPTLYQDWYQDTSPGPVLLTLAHHQREQHRYSESLRTLETALAAQPEADWSVWRTQAHYAALLATIPTYDLEGARRQFAAGVANAREGISRAWGEN